MNVFTFWSCFVNTYACQYVIDSKVGLNRLLTTDLMHMLLIPVKLNVSNRIILSIPNISFVFILV